MIKHYEHLWEEAELVADKVYNNKLKDCVNDIIKYSNDMEEGKEETLGNIIFALCFLSKHFNINAYTALRGAIDNVKIEMLDEDL